MMKPLTPAAEKAYINKLLADDKRVTGLSSDYYQQALQNILAHLNYYLLRYGVDGVLKYVNLLKRNDADALAEVDRADRTAKLDKSTDQQASQHERLLTAQAKVSRYEALNALIGWSVAGASLSTINLLAKTLKSDYRDNLSRQYQANKALIKAADLDVDGTRTTRRQLLKNADKVIYTSVNGNQWSTGIWSYNDELVKNVQNLIAKNLRHGLNQQDLSRLFPSIRAKRSGTVNELFDINNNYIKRMIVTERARVLYSASVKMMRSTGVDTFLWVTQNGACPRCQDIESGNPYSLEDPDAPTIPDSSHPNCRCTIMPYSGDVKTP